MKVRLIVVLLGTAGLLAACGSSSSSSPNPPGTATAAEVDVQAATACKTMETTLTNTEGGKAISGSDAQNLLHDSGVLIRTPDGHPPSTLDPVPTWYDLGAIQVQLLTAISDGDAAAVADFTSQARALCVTIPVDAQQAAKYTPTTA